jgi:hypothetical protein
MTNLIVTNSNMIDNHDDKSSNVHRAFISVEGTWVNMKQEHTKLSARNCQFFLKKQDREKKEPIIFHIRSIGAINAAILVSYVKENRTLEGSGQRFMTFGNIFRHIQTRERYYFLMSVRTLHLKLNSLTFICCKTFPIL